MRFELVINLKTAKKRRADGEMIAELKRFARRESFDRVK
jgi:hypothetical protein